MMFGTIPFLTKGPICLFLGGEEIIDSLGDEDPGKALLHLCVFSIFFQIFNSIYKKIKTDKLQSVNDYAQSLRTTIVNNVSNIYGLLFLFCVNFTLLIYLFRQVNLSLKLNVKACNMPGTIQKLKRTKRRQRSKELYLTQFFG